MSAALATAIKGLDVIDDVQALRTISAEQLDIPPLAFEGIVETLASVDFVRNVQSAHGSLSSFYESVPEDFDRLYDTLGEVWSERNPGEVEQALVATVDDLSLGPRPVDELDVDPSAVARMITLGEAADSIRIAPVSGRNVAYSPFFAYEHPETVAEALGTVDIAQVRAVFETVRNYQGSPVSLADNTNTMTGLVSAGVLMGPTLERPDGSTEAFAVAPYGLSSDMLVTRKAILDKALAVLAAVRMGEHFGGATSLFAPVALLRALRSGRVIGPHSSIRRQYAVLNRLSIVRLINRTNPLQSVQLVDTDDNKEAVDLAIELASHGEAIATREERLTPSRLLLPNATYRSPIQSLRPARRKYVLPDLVLEEMTESLLRRRPVDQ